MEPQGHLKLENAFSECEIKRCSKEKNHRLRSMGRNLIATEQSLTAKSMA
jgi:hypothetical protein